MPIVKSSYNPPWIFRNYHIATIYASAVRRVRGIHQERERLELEDGDFLDLDWTYAENEDTSKVLVVIHGLEGSSKRPYVLGMAKQFSSQGWDVAALNLRGCSGEINRLFRSYNAGASEDLKEVVTYILRKYNYSTLAIVGFSLGGNLMLKYLGEGNELPAQLCGAVAISTPCDLHRSLLKLEEPGNLLYSQRFVKKLKKQLLLRAKKFPNELARENISACKSLYAIDELYTGKAHGFENALDYYQKSSALHFISSITIPTLLINARNDGFISGNSSPAEMAKNHRLFYLETPRFGGHVAFLQIGEHSYAEERAFRFINLVLKNSGNDIIEKLSG